ncbi:ABC transporter permease subunit [Bacillus aquiflavi]|uniref:ABC transporter permease subunit n=1 Tax=Bacillus aquiflavi TaxID=2672567 RepID=A0A6B3VU14_9BACI|nr:ABC transporter permease subunit [Bacillus aquiflavi]MBA4536340.1 ABC transporter permease subunit [Bacillus aquiflavi]NEY80708.1 ABC transporter permease subunit [Bacillus aquiflavi]UAC48038.1 ABC transporter permease subunit [Bacillus aquiflavi]
MWAICFNEFKGHFKSIKSIIVIAIIFGVTFLSADFMTNVAVQLELEELGTDRFAIGAFFMIFVFGFIFITGLSHDLINREVSTRTMRFLVTKTSRTKILLGKYFGVWLFWLFCIFTSFILITIISKNFLWSGIIENMIFISAALALNLIFSILIPKPSVSMFFGIVFALVFPVISFWAIYDERLFIHWFKFFTPYYYSTIGHSYFLINIGYTVVLLLIAIKLFERRDL